MKQDLVWRSEWDMNIPHLDNQHHDLFQQLNRIEACNLSTRNECSHTCEELLESFLDKMREHFTAEEQLMDDVDFPEIADHRREHAMLMAELRELIREVSQGTESCDTIIHEIREWYVSHVAMDGREFANYFHNQNEVVASAETTSSVSKS